MATIHFNHVGIRAISSCVPKNIVYNKELDCLFQNEEIETIIEHIGVRERRIADEDVCASDLCFKAATALLADNDISPDSIDAMLFMSQTSDYRIPATAPTLQERLNLPTDTLCMDLSLGCSGFVYALSTAFAYTSMEGINRVLLLVGETFSKIVNRRDKVNWPLYGDGGTATLIEKGDFEPSTFILRTDGSGKDAIMVRDGMRNKITPESFIEKEDEGANIRRGLEIFMDGMAVFNFAMKRVPRSIRDMIETTRLSIDDIDWLVFHQANQFMTDFFIKKLKINPQKVPYSIHQYGNTSSASIPITIVSELHDKLKNGDRVMMAGFGAGLSWGTALVQMNDCTLSPMIEY